MATSESDSTRRRADDLNAGAHRSASRPDASVSTPIDSIPEQAARAQLERVLGSTAFRYSERLSRFLRFIVEQRLAGHADQLKESVIAVEIFDREASYDTRVESVVRVQAGRLREKLERYYDGEGRDDPVHIALPKGSYVPYFTPRNGETADAPDYREQPAVTQLPVATSARTILLVAAGSVLATLAVTQFFAPRRTPPPALRRVTSDSGLTFRPALSPDGSLLAYASDRSGSGHLDIWVQQIPGGEPRRLTANAADSLDPAFSPDGTIIAYRTEGEADGIYLAPVLGGMSTLLVRGGYRPRFSPDGARVAYWTGERSFQSASVFLIPAAGGTPVQLQPEFRYASHPIWSPDGKYVLFVGSKLPVAEWESGSDKLDWWVSPVSGGPAVRTSARRVFVQQGLEPPRTGWSHRNFIPYHWAASGRILFSARRNQQTNVWHVPISARDWQITGPADQLTFGAGREDQPDMSSDGSLVFAVLTEKTDVWSLPLSADSMKQRGPMERLTSDPSYVMNPKVCEDGTRVAFLSRRTGNYDVWTMDLKTGRESPLTSTREDETTVAISPDGSQVAYGYLPPMKQAIFVAPFSGGRTERLCPDCGELRFFLPAGQAVLYQRRSASGEWLIGTVGSTGRESQWFRSSDAALFSPSVSHDGRWLAMIKRKAPNEHRVIAVPLHAGSPAAPSSWVAVTGPDSWVDKPRWSPSGNLIYYVSDRDGFVCIWARRFDGDSGHAFDEPVSIAHFHKARNSLGTIYGLELSVAVDKLVFNLGEESGNIWLAPAAK